MFAEKNDIVKSEDIIKKIIESIIIQNGNKPLKVDNIISSCNKQYYLEFTEDEIKKIAYSSSNFVVIKDRELLVSLLQESYLKKKDEFSKISIDTIIDVFLSEKKYDIQTKELLYDYLYRLVNESINTFNKSFDNKYDSSIFDKNTLTEYNSEDSSIINNFLNWDNEDKNKTLFNLFIYGLEYCLITSNKKIDISGVQNKCFFLDTNIIFSAIGINGEKAQHSIEVFFEKCNETHSELFITWVTEKEIKNTIDNYINEFQLFPSNEINPTLFNYDSFTNSFASFYNKWKTNRINVSVDYFSAYIESLIYGLFSKYKISIKDKSTSFTVNNEDRIREEDELIQSLKKYKKEKGQNIKSDVDNYLLTKYLRANGNKSFFEVKYFFISNDSRLRVWDSYRSSNIPIILQPHQWLSFVLKFHGRTTDDFKSFVSFLNINSSTTIFPKGKLSIILSAISELTQDFEQQRFLLETLIKNNFNKKVKNQSDADIYKQVGLIGTNILSEKVQNLEKSLKKRDEIITESKMKIGSLEQFRQMELEPILKNIEKLNADIEFQKTKIQELRNEKNGLNKTASTKINDLNKTIKTLIKEKDEQHLLYIETEAVRQFDRWKRKSYYLYVFVVLLFLICALSVIARNWQYNFISEVFNYIDSIPSPSQQNALIGMYYTFIAGLFGYCISLIIKMNSKQVRIKKLNEFKTNAKEEAKKAKP